MTLHEFLDVFCGLDDIVIYHQDEPDGPVFEGTILDVPYMWLNNVVMKRDETADYEGAYISQDLDGTNSLDPKFNHRAGLVISIK